MNNTGILLRGYNEAEIEDLRRLERAAHRRYLSLKEYEKFATAPAINPERFSTGTTKVAEFAGHRAGYIIVQPLDDMLYIASLMVDDGMSGKGIGQKLLKWAEDYASASGVSGTCLATFRAPRWNAPWYRKLGYAEIPEGRIGPNLQAILDRHATFLDMTTRIAMWKPTGACPE
ncbi:MAG: GNAT family N-acetyltransferase [Loktanella sp.]|nr:GNAT family N-acetyltransferase [Loktanella sp.]